MSDSPPPADALANQQRAFLLKKFATAEAGGLTPSQAESAPAWAKKTLGLTPDAAKRLVERMMADQLLVLNTVKGKDKIAITTAGRELLGTLAAFVPTEPPKREKKPRAPKAPKKSPAEVVAEKVRAKVAALADEEVVAERALGKPGGKKVTGEQAEAFADTLAELVRSGALHPHPGGRYGKRAYLEPVDPDAELREAYILDIFSRAKNRAIPKADLERAFDGKLQKKPFESDYPDVIRFRGQGCFLLNPAATRHAVSKLLAEEYLEAVGSNGDATYMLTAAGAERLKDLRHDFPVLPPVGKPARPDDEKMRSFWEAFVLLHLLNAPDHAVGADTVYAVSYPKKSKLNHATAWKLRGELVAAGRAELEGAGDTAAYRLTDAGKARLAGLSFDTFPDVTLTGTALTALLAAARGGANEPGQTPAPTKATPSAAELEKAVMDIFLHLLRERHANIRMVPIHEVRAEVKKQFGERAASHEVFDELLLGMRRKQAVRLTSIADRSRATHEQLQHSVVAVGETFFYMEPPDAPVGG